MQSQVLQIEKLHSERLKADSLTVVIIGCDSFYYTLASLLEIS
jgi:hypothetical protein